MRNKAKRGQKIRASATKTDDQEKNVQQIIEDEVLSLPNEKIIKEERKMIVVFYLFS